MPHLELGFSPQDDKHTLVESQTEDLTSQSSALLAGRSSAIMERFFTGIAQPLDREVLSETGRDLIHAIRRGFLANMQYLGRDVWGMKPEELDFLLHRNRAYSEHVPNPEDTEAFGRFHIATGIVPQIATDQFIPEGFSRNGRLAAPATIGGIYGRIHETGLQIHQVATGEIGVKPDPWNRPALSRTYWTVVAMANIPEKVTDSVAAGKEALEKLRVKFANPQDR